MPMLDNIKKVNCGDEILKQLLQDIESGQTCLKFLDTGPATVSEDVIETATRILGSHVKVISTRDVPLQWYAEAARAIREAGIECIQVIGVGWWIGDGNAPAAVRIVDHVACHLPNPLTGSDRARRGEAFVNMRDAYEKDWPGKSDMMKGDFPETVMWHTSENLALSMEEKNTAGSAGCGVASMNVAPWAVAARSEGMRIAAAVVCCLASPPGPLSTR